MLRDPVGEISAHRPEEVAAALCSLEAAVRQDGLMAAGFLSYELGYVLEPRLLEWLPPSRPMPLLWFALFESETKRRWSLADLQQWAGPADNPEALSPPLPQIDEHDYSERFAKVQRLIARGEIYQLNLTFKARFTFRGRPRALFTRLLKRQPVAYGGYIATPDFHLLSLSPELFIRLERGRLLTKPMKGTAPRGKTLKEDEKRRADLAADPKNRAENLMITDLMRNDLGRLAKPGTVVVPELYTVETFPTLHQMTSSITAQVPKDLSLGKLFEALFPPGSIVGAPKIRGQQIIAQLEREPRGVYTGAIGFIEPPAGPDDGVRARFNVAIRTLTLRPRTEGGYHGEVGIGSGIVADSKAAHEWRECLLKMQFLQAEAPTFQLIETLKFTAPEGYYLLERHLERLAASIRYFDFQALDRDTLSKALEQAGQQWRRVLDGQPGKMVRARLLYHRDGRFELSGVVIDAPPPDAQMRFVISPKAVDSGNIFLYHKTTNRAFYDHERERLKAELGPQIHLDEVLFENQRGELTEGSISNLFVQKAGRLLTPPIEAGLLPGTLRAELLASGKAEEAVLTREDLVAAEAVFLGNSVRGLIRGQWILDEARCPMV